MEIKPGIDGWHEVDGDNTLALDWPLTMNSHVWEIGGYEGRWAKQIWDKYKCHITIFEPQLWAVQKLYDLFSNNEFVDIRPYGLWTQTRHLKIGNFHTDGASLIYDDEREEAQLGFFKALKDEISYSGVDVALMNIEGAEYVLLPEIIKAEKIKLFKNIWVQFHPIDGNDHRFVDIAIAMSKTHDLLWNYFPTAVAWRKRE